ncbi:MAG: hypothetical protein Q9176_007436 [Flavoplaca citrina]
MDYRDLASSKKHALHPHPSLQQASRSTSLAPPILNHAHNNFLPLTDNTIRTLDIYLHGITHQQMTIADEDKTRPLYTVENSPSGLFSSRNLTIYKAADTENPEPGFVGTAMFGKFDFHGHSVDMSLNHHSLTYVSPAFEQRLCWETDGEWGVDLVLVGAKKEFIARIDPSLSGCSTFGQLHIFNGAIGTAALDEIVVSGCAFVQYERRIRNRTSAGGGAATGGAY